MQGNYHIASFKVKLATVQLVLGLVGLVASRDASAQHHARRATQGADSAAKGQFAKFLDISVATHAPKLGRYASVYCREGEEYQLTRWLADFEVVRVDVRGDSATAVAVVTTVADQSDRTGRWVAARKIRTDTAHWHMVREPAGSGVWRVCGDANEGFSMIMTGPDMIWRPLGASRKRAFADVDSIRRGRGHAVIR
jgi:hypothetical protein